MIEKIKNSITLLQQIKENADFLHSIEKTKRSLINSIENTGTIMICGNGGSATQSSHMMGELVGRFSFNRPALPAISLFDLATTTAIGNDYGYDAIFSRFIEGLGKKSDILLCLSTSGNSKNCLAAIKSAKEKGIISISLLGKDGGEMKNYSDISIIVPSDNTPLIQEIHLMIIHDMCDKIEKHFFQK